MLALTGLDPQSVTSERWEKALIAGVIAALLPFATGALIASSNQKRAESGAAVPADVPVAAKSYDG
jgi:hypothetical protein